MDIIFARTANGNFGDDLNLWFWDDILPGWRGWDPSITLIGVGTLVNDSRLGTLGDRRLLILGSGVGFGQGGARTKPPVTLPLSANWDVRAVRGPSSARALDLSPEHGIMDPAGMLPTLPRFADIERHDDPIFVPHCSSTPVVDWPAVCAASGLVYVSPHDDAVVVIKRIAGARLVIAESMHAAIIADAFRVPWVPAMFSPQFNRQKWYDVFEALGYDGTIHTLYPRHVFGRAIRKIPVLADYLTEAWLHRSFDRIQREEPFLSADTTLTALQSRYSSVLEAVASQYR